MSNIPTLGATLIGIIGDTGNQCTYLPLPTISLRNPLKDHMYLLCRDSGSSEGSEVAIVSCTLKERTYMHRYSCYYVSSGH